jgi:hypothetical protein
MPTAKIRISTSNGSISAFDLIMVYNYISANTWTSPGKNGGEWISSSTVNGIYVFNGPESTDIPVWLKLFKVQWDLGTDLEKGMTGVGVLCATFKPVAWEVVSS